MKPKYDFFVFKKDYNEPECPSCCYTEQRQYRLDTFIWLPRQDQLQALLELDNRPAYALDSVANHLLNSHDIKPYWKQFTSTEQLWLAFVMEKNYKKRWRGGNWVNEV
ncbi:MAG: hypothetical protein JW924_03195 [Fusobacteriaceae bacterium]|nr:hypothetical protein [Fusobacteriaceae bacterium]